MNGQQKITSNSKIGVLKYTFTQKHVSNKKICPSDIDDYSTEIRSLLEKGAISKNVKIIEVNHRISS